MGIKLGFDDIAGDPDSLTLADVGLNNSGYKATVRYLSNLTGSDGHDYVIDKAPVAGGTYSLNDGDDTLIFQGSQLSLTDKTIDMGTGTDTVDLSGAVATNVTVTNAENVTLGAGNNIVSLVTGNTNDTLTLTGNLAAGSTVDMGAGTDTLSLAGSDITLAVTNVESILMGSDGPTNLTLDNETAETIVYNFLNTGAVDNLNAFDLSDGDKIAFSTNHGDDASKFSRDGNMISYDADGAGGEAAVDIAQVTDPDAGSFVVDVDHVVYQAA